MVERLSFGSLNATRGAKTGGARPRMASELTPEELAARQKSNDELKALAAAEQAKAAPAYAPTPQAPAPGGERVNFQSNNPRGTAPAYAPRAPADIPKPWAEMDAEAARANAEKVPKPWEEMDAEAARANAEYEAEQKAKNTARSGAPMLPGAGGMDETPRYAPEGYQNPMAAAQRDWLARKQDSSYGMTEKTVRHYIDQAMSGPNAMGQIAHGELDPMSPEGIHAGMSAAWSLPMQSPFVPKGSAGVGGGKLIQPPPGHWNAKEWENAPPLSNHIGVPILPMPKTSMPPMPETPAINQYGSSPHKYTPGANENVPPRYTPFLPGGDRT